MKRSRSLFVLYCLLGGGVSATHFLTADDSANSIERKRTGNYEYLLITAESRNTSDNQKVLSNLNGQIGLTYEMKKAARGSESGIDGMRWEGRTNQVEDRSVGSISLSDGPKKFVKLRIAYDLDGKDSTINLEDANHKGTIWEWVTPKKEWWDKYKAPHHAPFHLRATEGRSKGYYLAFEEPEVVKIREDASYARRRAVLSKEPSEMGVLMKLEIRER